MIKIWISWHRKELLPLSYKDDIFHYLDNFIIDKKLDKNDIIFNLWWAHWVDNTIWQYCIENNIEYHLYLPFTYNENQIEEWSKSDIDDFYNVLNNENCTVTTSWSWYLWRNREIVNNSDIMIVWYLWDEKSGTWYTVKYAKKKDVHIYNIYNINIY